MKAGGAGRSDSGCESTRMDARPKQGFVDVDISESAQEPLVQQQRFYASLPSAQFADKVIECNGEGFGTQSRDALWELLGVFNAAELARVVVHQDASVEFEDPISVGTWRRTNKQFAGHAEMDGQRPAVKFDHDEFASPLDALNSAPHELARQFVSISRRDKARAEHCARDGAPGEVWCHRADYGFDFREFRHVR